jgi:hypothetical protein
VAYGGRVWFVNSIKFVDHNSADVYSYDPVSSTLSAVTSERFGYDTQRWRSWWEKRRNSDRGAMVEIPGGTCLMGSDRGEPAEQPVHRVVKTFSMDRFETTNASSLNSYRLRVILPMLNAVGLDGTGMASGARSRKPTGATLTALNRLSKISGDTRWCR